jgi:hypothetical protein
MLRPEIVGKAVVISTNPTNVLGGQALGRLFCEVVVKVVIKRDSILPRPYGYIETLADAMSMPVQWPYNRVINNLDVTFFLLFIYLKSE